MVRPPPSLPCPFCNRYLYNTSGRSRHIDLQHPEELIPQNPSSAPPPEQSPSHDSRFDQLPSSHGGFDADVDMDIDPPNFNWDEILSPGPHIDSGQESNRSLSPADGAEDRHAPDPPPLTRVYHTEIDGKSRLLMPLYGYKCLL